jgi:hypothetical protein
MLEPNIAKHVAVHTPEAYKNHLKYFDLLFQIGKEQSRK